MRSKKINKDFKILEVCTMMTQNQEASKKFMLLKQWFSAAPGNINTWHHLHVSIFFEKWAEWNFFDSKETCIACRRKQYQSIMLREKLSYSLVHVMLYWPAYVIYWANKTLFVHKADTMLSINTMPYVNIYTLKTTNYSRFNLVLTLILKYYKFILLAAK